MRNLITKLLRGLVRQKVRQPGDPIIRRSILADPQSVRPETPIGEVLSCTKSRQLGEGVWEHTYEYMTNEQLVEQEVRYTKSEVDQNGLESTATVAFIANTKDAKFIVPPVQHGFAFDRASPPQQVTPDKWLHVFHYKPVV